MKIKWLTMPIPEKGATFAFKARITKDEFNTLMSSKQELDYDRLNDHGHLIYLIGHINTTDHIATYVPETETLFTSTREVFR